MVAEAARRKAVAMVERMMLMTSTRPGQVLLTLSTAVYEFCSRRRIVSQLGSLIYDVEVRIQLDCTIRIRVVEVVSI